MYRYTFSEESTKVAKYSKAPKSAQVQSFCLTLTAEDRNLHGLSILVERSYKRTQWKATQSFFRCDCASNCLIRDDRSVRAHLFFSVAPDRRSGGANAADR